eukprot:6616535-Prymnesium_polylepis.1
MVTRTCSVQSALQHECRNSNSDRVLGPRATRHFGIRVRRVVGAGSVRYGCTALTSPIISELMSRYPIGHRPPAHCL